MPKDKKTTNTKKGYQKKAASKMLRSVKRGRIYIQSTFNNTILTFTDPEGKVLCWGSSGASGFSGTRKHTPFAAKTAIEGITKKAQAFGLRELEVYVKGPGSGRDAVLRALRSLGFKMTMIADVTPMPHNGPRPRKRRRG